MDKEKILNILKSMPNFNKDLIEKYKQRIEIAITCVEAKLVKKADKAQDVLTYLCAALVNLWITMEICANSASGSFAGNGYKIKKNTKKQFYFAKKMFDHWRSTAANFLVDEGFSFFAIKEPELKWTLKKTLKKQ